MLRVENLEIRYGEVEAIRGLYIQVGRGEAVALIGANGAGKTSLLRAVSGLKRPSGGRIFFEESRIDTCRPALVARRGIAHVPEGRHVFAGLSVLDNLYLGAFAIGSTRKAKAELGRIFSLFPVLGERAGQESGTLSGGEQQLLVIARALMSRPKLLLLDEPSLGLAPLFVQKVFSLIGQIKKEGLTILLVEQNARMALKYAERGYVMEMGRIVMEDRGSELLKNQKLREWYLGGKEAL
jgi:branched-chain amino acid transport system ATP-binding protein